MVLDVFNSSDLNKVVCLNDLSKSHCYTCILQHPENHIVYSAAVYSPPYLKLIAIYELNAMPPLISIDSDDFVDGCVRELANPEQTQEYLMESKMDEDTGIWERAFRVFGEHSTPIDYLRSKEDVQQFRNYILENRMDSWSSKDPILSTDLTFDSDSKYFPPAWILTNTATGHTREIKNPFYEMAKKLRCFQPNIRFQYLYLMRDGLVETYLLAFPRYGEIFKYLKTEYDNFITEVYNAYVKFYIMNIRDGSIPKKRFIHAARIHHNVYRAQLTPRRKINMQDVERYFSAIALSKMIYYLTVEN